MQFLFIETCREKQRFLILIQPTMVIKSMSYLALTAVQQLRYLV